MPAYAQSHFCRRLANESKLADLEGGQPLVGIVKTCPGISVVVMLQVKMKGRQPGNSPDLLEKNLPGIHQVSAGHHQMP